MATSKSTKYANDVVEVNLDTFAIPIATASFAVSRAVAAGSGSTIT